MISLSHKFVLITPPKTGSTSLATALKDVVKMAYILKQSNDCYDFKENEGDTEFAKHMSLSKYASRVDIQEYALFGSIRNPYSRVVSWWRWSIERRSRRRRQLSFLRWLKHPRRANDRSLTAYFIHNDITIENFIRFEDLNASFKSFCDQVGLEDRELPHSNKSKHKHYTEYYNNETRRIVARKYAEDLERFGYEFGE